MALVHFIFAETLPLEDQENILHHMNHPDYWGGVEKAGRLYPDADESSTEFRTCYFTFTESGASSRNRRNEVLAQHVFNMDKVRKHQYEAAWIVEEEPEGDDEYGNASPVIWQA